jgi:hypothetical protein
MQTVSKALIALAVIAGTVVVSVSILVWLMNAGCGDNEEAVRAMRALPTKRLETLYQYAQSGYETHKNDLPINFDPKDSPAPQELADLNPKGMRYFGDTLGVHVSGCVDDKIYLFVEGLEQGSEHKQIVLTLGEWNGSEVLWKK